jgi:hypothetical protein
MRDFERTILSQYSSAAKLCALITTFNDYIDPDANLEAFYNLIWNVDTAQGYGLDVWGRIVGVERTLTVTESGFFGFEQGNWKGWNQAPFYSGTLVTDNFVLTDQAFRALILAKAAANITDSSIPAINKIMMTLFPGRGNAYVRESQQTRYITSFGFQQQGSSVRGWNQAPFNQSIGSYPFGMQMTYVFEFALEPFEIAIVTSGVLPKPTGVHADFSYLTV